MHVVIVTVAHSGSDARIVHRQARSLLLAGHTVTLVAPIPDCCATDPSGLIRVGVPRAQGINRLRSWRAARSAVASVMRLNDVNLLVLHDIELVGLFASLSKSVAVVWDVHEDYSAAVTDRRYIFRFLRGKIRFVVKWIERLALRKLHIILAEYSYRARFGEHPVVINSTWMPDIEPLFAVTDEVPRVVYLGRISRSRGAIELIELGRRLGARVKVQLIGEPDPDVRNEVAQAHERGEINWLGYLPNPEANQLLQGALVGLSLLHEHDNFAGSLPTKIVEYFAHGLPVITSDLPLAANLVASAGGGSIVPFDDLVGATTAEIIQLLNDPARRASMGSAGYRYVRKNFSWDNDGQYFVGLLEGWARSEA